jgi:hypothetical protein
MGFNFPDSPTLGQEYEDFGARYIWNGYGWRVNTKPPVPPAETLLTGDTVPVSATIGTLVGTLSSINVVEGTPAYSLINDAGGLFAIVGNLLQTANVLTVPNVNLDNNRIADTAPVGTTVGTFNVANVTGEPVYTLIDNAGGMFTLAGDLLQTAGALDYAMASQYTVTLNVAGVTPSIPDKTFTIIVTDVAEAGDVLLSNNTIAENSPIGSVIGTFSCLNVTGTPVYSLVDSAGGRFSIVGSNLQVAVELDFEAP